MLVVLNLCMVWGLVGDDCKNESAEKCEAEAGGQHDVARRKGGFEFGFGFVGHGFGFGGWNKRMCVGEPHLSVCLVANNCYSFVRLFGMMNPDMMTACTPKERSI
jgi:hypothetical protein